MESINNPEALTIKIRKGFYITRISKECTTNKRLLSRFNNKPIYIINALY